MGALRRAHTGRGAESPSLPTRDRPWWVNHFEDYSVPLVYSDSSGVLLGAVNADNGDFPVRIFGTLVPPSAANGSTAPEVPGVKLKLDTVHTGRNV